MLLANFAGPGVEMTASWKAEDGGSNTPEKEDSPMSGVITTSPFAATTTHTMKVRVRSQSFLGQVRHTIGLENPGPEQTDLSEVGQTIGSASSRSSTGGLEDGRTNKRLPSRRRNSSLAQLVQGLGNLIPSERKTTDVNTKDREIKTLPENLAVLRAAVSIMFPPARRRMVRKLKGLFAADKLPGITRWLLSLARRVSRTAFQSYRVP